MHASYCYKFHYYWQQLTQAVVMLFSATASFFKYRFHHCLAWQNTEYFEIPYDKWRIFCVLLYVKISFREHIIKASVLFSNFVHERQYCSLDSILWVDGLHITPPGVVTCHKNYASNICNESASYFYSSVSDTPWQYCNIWAFNHNPYHIYDVSFFMVKKNP